MWINRKGGEDHHDEDDEDEEKVINQIKATDDLDVSGTKYRHF